MSVGVDIEDVKRFENLSQAFIDRIYTKSEQEYCLSKAKPASHFAVRFCAKEAVTKALNSMGLKQPTFKQMEVFNNENGCPFVKLPDDKMYDNLKIEISLSHDKTKAIAFVRIGE